jgi:hypothetical protein
MSVFSIQMGIIVVGYNYNFVLVSEVVLLVASFVDFPIKQSSRGLCVISSVVKALN